AEPAPSAAAECPRKRSRTGSTRTDDHNRDGVPAPQAPDQAPPRHLVPGPAVPGTAAAPAGGARGPGGADLVPATAHGQVAEGPPPATHDRSGRQAGVVGLGHRPRRAPRRAAPGPGPS